MKNIRIMHLFPKRLSLYGEYGNVSIMKKTLNDEGYTVSVEAYEEGVLSLDGIYFVYVGSGTENALMIANKILTEHADSIKASVNAGTLWLATGNAPALFGSSISRNSNTVDALGLFPYSCTINDKDRFMGDVITDDNNLFHAPLIGFVNTSCIFKGIDTPLSSFKLNTTLGNDKKSPSDGLIFNNFFAAQMIGPFLVKNPPALQEIYRRVTGNKDFTLPVDSNAQKAYESALKELSNRI